MPVQFSIVTAEDGSQAVVVFANGRLTPPADESHPNFKSIIAVCQRSMTGAEIDAEALLDLFDIAATIERKFARLSERVTVENGEIMFDGDPAESGLSAQILRFMDAGEAFEPLVNFMEKIGTNPVAHSREQAWAWLNNHDFTITPDGDVVAYKGVQEDGAGGYRSTHRGNAIRNGEEIKNSYVGNAVGDIVEMRRSEVAANPSQACSSGLHVGTYSYAQQWSNSGCMLRVIINPRDIVSVPNDASGQKIRVCRYVVDAIIEAADEAPLFAVGFKVGDRVEDEDGDRGVIVKAEYDAYEVHYDVHYDDEDYSNAWLEADELTRV